MNSTMTTEAGTVERLRADHGVTKRAWAAGPAPARRTFMYLGAIASASLISLCYGRQATDAGLHRLGMILTVAAVALLAATLADRSLARQVRA
jgi:hypothetical protein